MLAVLTLAVHPFQLPDQSRALSLELLPPLATPPTPTVEVQLRPRQPETTPPPQAPVRAPITPETQVPFRPAEAIPAPPPRPRQPQEQAKPQLSELEKPVEVERQPVQAPKLQTQQAAPQIPQAPPEPVPVTGQAPALQPQVEVPQAQGRPQPLDTSRAAPALPQAGAPEAAAPPSQVQVLTNGSVIQAPVEIRPRERSASPPALTTRPGAPAIPAPVGGAPAGGGPAGGPQGGRAAGPKVEDFQGMTGLKGLKGGLLGCDTPELYKLTAEERTACEQQFGQRGRSVELGLAIAASKQREYDSYEACQNAYRRKQGSIPNAYQKADGAAVAGVANLPKECVPLKNR